jgi:hypothetical protein
MPLVNERFTARNNPINGHVQRGVRFRMQRHDQLHCSFSAE